MLVGDGGQQQADDDELGVFTAERYFSGALAAEDALWCDRSSSSFSSLFKPGRPDGSAPTPTAATSSSEASWNSRSALLPNPLVVVAPAVESKLPSWREGERHTGMKPPLSAHSHLRRWLCACAGGGDVEESVCGDVLRDEVDPGGPVLGVTAVRCTESDAMLPPARTSEQSAAEEVAMVRVRPGKWVDDVDPLIAGVATVAPVQYEEAQARHRRGTKSGESSMRFPYPATNFSSDERRRKSVDISPPAGAQGRAEAYTLGPATQDSAFTIVAGRTARGGGAISAAGDSGGGSPEMSHMACGSGRDSGEDDEASSELDYMYPPSEASVVWSVVTADGAASGNFSSAASGYYHFYYDGGGGYEEAAALRNTAGAKSSSRRSISGRIINGGSSGGLLMGCMSERADDTIGPSWTSSSVNRPEVEAAAIARRSAATASRGGPDVMRRR